MLNFTKYLLIIFLNSGLYYCYSTECSDPPEPELQAVYNKYDTESHPHIKVPKNLCDLYEFHKTHILRDYKGYYANKENHNHKIFDFCFGDFVYGNFWLFPDEDLEADDEEILSTIQHACHSPGPLQTGEDFKISRHPNPGHSGAEIYVLHKNSKRNTRIAKVLKCQSLEDLSQGFLELSNSLIALGLNPNPSNIKMTRVLSAGYSYFPDSKEPYVFCMIMEKARGKSIKELLHKKFINNPDLFERVLHDSAQYLTHFHVNSYREFIKIHTIDPEVKRAEIKDREKFCRRRLGLLLQDLGFTLRGDSYFNFKEALKNIEGIFHQGIQILPRKITDHAFARNISFGQHLRETLANFEKSSLALEDRVITHGDMHIGNLCCKEDCNISPLHQFTMIDFSSIKRTVGAIGDPAQDVGKYFGSVCKEVALCLAHIYGDKESMETWYSILCKWQEVFISSYMEAYTRAEADFQEKRTSHASSAAINQDATESFNMNKMANFRERVYFYKLCLYAQFFDDAQIGAQPKNLLQAKQLLFYFLLRESGLLESKNLELPSQDPARSFVEVSVEYSLARVWPTGNKVIDKGIGLGGPANYDIARIGFNAVFNNNVAIPQDRADAQRHLAVMDLL